MVAMPASSTTCGGRVLPYCLVLDQRSGSGFVLELQRRIWRGDSHKFLEGSNLLAVVNEHQLGHSDLALVEQQRLSSRSGAWVSPVPRR